VSPNARGNARDKSRNQKRETVLEMRDAQSRRNRQVVSVVLIAVLVVAGFVGLSQVLKQDDKASPAPAAGAAGQTTAPKSTATSAAGCSPAPQVPSDKRSGTLPDKATAAGKTFIATVTTSCGVITMELDGTKAPQTVASFLGLAKGGYWADSPCHRLTTTGIFVLQCGDPTGTGGGDPGYGYGVENAPADFTFPPGTLAMARTQDPNSNGGQFFIVYKETMLPDAVGYSIFGKVTSGMDIVDKVAAAGTNPAGDNPGTAPMQPISILTVTVAEKKA
jgi:peptidyl-prolyl cis-trans isomerase B (cyclophilin B)